jgi:Amt family ammonium transporter
LTGLLYGGGFTVLIAQMIGSAIVTGATFGVALVLMYAVNALGVLRVSEEGELQGLDLHEHGIPAYPEYALHAGATPRGAPDFTDKALAPAPGMAPVVAHFSVRNA